MSKPFFHCVLVSIANSNVKVNNRENSLENVVQEVVVEPSWPCY